MERSFFSQLKTRTNFDGVATELESSGTNSARSVTSKLRSSSTSSMLTLALIFRLCCSMESDNDRRDKLYRAVCEEFCKLKYLNRSVVSLCEQMSRPLQFDAALTKFVQQIHNNVLYSSQSLVPSSVVHLNRKFNLSVATPFQTNRYDESFQELEVIGSGGSGVVCKAVHKVDGVVYAVKKIFFNYKNDVEFEKIIREARSIAALKHENIVNYNNAWLDYGNFFSEKSDSEKEGRSTTDSSENNTPERSLRGPPTSQANEPEIIFSHEVNESESSIKTKAISALSMECVYPCESVKRTVKAKDVNCPAYIEHVQENSELDEISVPAFENRRRHSSGATCTDKDALQLKVTEYHVEDAKKLLNLNHFNIGRLSIKATLYIQMEYCECDLHSWLDRRNAKNGNDGKFLDPKNIFLQALCGVEYIHSKSVIHRDLKPQNIFISIPNGVVKIGDFGLACLVDQTEEVFDPYRMNNLSNVHGTPPYSAPEQIRGKKYDFKVDIYSMGVILFELLYPCLTKMEFYTKVSGISKGDFPEEMKQNSPQHVELIINMIKKQPLQRPTAREILESPIFEKRSLRKNIEGVKKKLANITHTHRTLNQCVSELLKEQDVTFHELLQENQKLHHLIHVKEAEKQVLMEMVTAKDKEILELKENLRLFQKHCDTSFL